MGKYGDADWYNDITSPEEEKIKITNRISRAASRIKKLKKKRKKIVKDYLDVDTSPERMILEKKIFPKEKREELERLRKFQKAYVRYINEKIRGKGSEDLNKLEDLLFENKKIKALLN